MNIHTIGSRQAPFVWWTHLPGITVHWSNTKRKGVFLMHVRSNGGHDLVIKQSTSCWTLTRLTNLTLGQESILRTLINIGVVSLNPKK
jgi:hypothetical protein